MTGESAGNDREIFGESAGNLQGMTGESAGNDRGICLNYPMLKTVKYAVV